MLFDENKAFCEKKFHKTIDVYRYVYTFVSLKMLDATLWGGFGDRAALTARENASIQILFDTHFSLKTEQPSQRTPFTFSYEHRYTIN